MEDKKPPEAASLPFPIAVVNLGPRIIMGSLQLSSESDEIGVRRGKKRKIFTPSASRKRAPRNPLTLSPKSSLGSSPAVPIESEDDMADRVGR